MRKATWIPGLIVAALLVAALVFRPDRALRVASGHVSHILCSTTFVTGLDPAQVFDEAIRPFGAFRWMGWLVAWRVDRERREVGATVAGGFANRAVYRDGRGCTVLPGARDRAPAPLAPSVPLTASVLPEIAGPARVETRDERLRAALDRAFVERDGPPFRRTKAVVIAHRGRVVAERYAPGYGVDARVLGWSVSKSVTSALVGILVRQGRLAVSDPAPGVGWRDPTDGRRAITIERLLRMTSGLALAETNSGFDPTSRMLYLEPDTAGYAQSAALRAEPGRLWQYQSGDYAILSRILRDAAGGSAQDLSGFAERELFGPLGMRHVVLEFDVAGTPVGSSYFLATPRDWVRFGLLYVNDGVIAGRRVLPEGWARFSAEPTLGTGYGAGFWTSAGPSRMAERERAWGMPADAFFGQGFLGQFVVIVPSAQVVVCRFGLTDRALRNDLEGVSRLVGEVVAILASPPRS
jgi:CubicO group peptidase (beta-lactamase class C family)